MRVFGKGSNHSHESLARPGPITCRAGATTFVHDVLGRSESSEYSMYTACTLSSAATSLSSSTASATLSAIKPT
jgi:hypothetical protein